MCRCAVHILPEIRGCNFRKCRTWNFACEYIRLCHASVTRVKNFVALSQLARKREDVCAKNCTMRMQIYRYQ